MRDQYAGDISDLLKFALLRKLAGADRKLGIAWYYAAGDDGDLDGRHLEWRDDVAWQFLDQELHVGLSSLPERTVAALEQAPIWPQGIAFHREPIPTSAGRANWSAQKRIALADADIVFLDPDNGLGRESKKHATLSEVRHLRRPDRALVFITFPGRDLPHKELVVRLHERLALETGAQDIFTLRTTVSIQTAKGSFVPRTRWFTILDTDQQLSERIHAFANEVARIPRVKASLES
ncbi:hypothetical protein ACFSM5_07025 [Lacibacterium aquatile]|uniref:Uncharacterized protein n=1 Tax=Lacibacterium aquatile TaxID=1168082 RepID=A0ABW5DQ47_9PROT